MTREKRQGTRRESLNARRRTEAGLPSRRLPEGGPQDEGDRETFAGRRWVEEDKERIRLAPHVELAKARKKAGDGTPVAVCWTRLVKKNGAARRTPDGEREIIILHPVDFETLLRCEQALAALDPDTHRALTNPSN